MANNALQGAEVLQNILKAALQGGVGMAQQSASDMAQRPVAGQVAKAAGVQDPGNGPVEMLMKLIGGATPSANASEPSMAYGFGTPQQGQQQQGAQKPQPDAFSKGSDKALSEYGYTSTMEAVMAGMSPMAVMQERSKMGGQTASNNMAPLLQGLLQMAQQPQAQQPQTSMQSTVTTQSPVDNSGMQQQAQQLIEPKGFMGRWQENFNKQVGNVTTADRLDNIGKAQKVMGQEPWQEGDKQKTRYEKMMALETSKISKDIEMDKLDITHATSYLDKISELPNYSGDELTKYTAMQEMNDAATKLSKRLESDPTALRTLGLPGDRYGQQTLLWANKVAANRKFFQGGSALTPMENKTLDSILAKKGLPAQLQDPKIAKETIDSIIEKVRQVNKRLDPYADDREFINEGRAMGVDDRLLTKALYKRRASRNKE